MDLMTGLMDQLNRNRELLNLYKSIGTAGLFGATMIARDIKSGEDAIKSMDTIEMLTVYNTLKDHK